MRAPTNQKPDSNPKFWMKAFCLIIKLKKIFI